MKRWILALAATVALGGALSACETATPYQPLAAGNAQSGGYSETKLEDNRWRVSFAGNSLTSRATVETYLLHRAAELTVAQGYDWFETAQRATDKHVDTFGTGFGPYDYGFGWRYFRRGGWYGDPFWGGPWGGPWGPDFDIQTIERFEATTEVVMHHGQKPVDNPHAFDARQVLTNTAAKVALPPK
jgi:hypothetical protein